MTALQLATLTAKRQRSASGAPAERQRSEATRLRHAVKARTRKIAG